MAKYKLFKLGAAAALTVTGASAITSLKTVRAANFTAIKRVKIKYLPGKSLNIWTHYNNGKFMGYRAKDGTVWNVAQTAVDKKGNLWYKIGTREWIEARYTVDVDKDTTVTNTAAKKTKKSKLTNLASKVKKATKKTKKNTVADAQKALKDAKAAEKKAKKDLAKAKAETKAKKVKKAKQIVNAAVKKTTTKKVASTQASSKAGAIVALAKQQIGKPYAWGANGPDSFDCSSLVQYVYQKAAGLNLPRTTYDQVKVGTTVPLDQLQAGDLLFWGSETAPYHVAIYIGNGQYVNSATPEQGTILQSMTSYFEPTIAKRVL